MTKTEKKKELQRIINNLSSIPCVSNTFDMCEGSYKNKLEMMITCAKCWLVADLRELKKHI